MWLGQSYTWSLPKARYWIRLGGAKERKGRAELSCRIFKTFTNTYFGPNRANGF